jgi:2-polyprenyl-3-methyl-5-hydroxy-6-metoxy-1,4-benzoquinol methylase
LTSIYQASGLLCLSCGKTSWESNTETLRCLSCESVYAIDNGVVRLHVPDENDDVTRLYTAIDGTHFLSASFEGNPLIYITTRAYLRFLERVFPTPAGKLMDFGCGDGRLSLWAAEKGFGPVVAVDSNLSSLQRLAAEASKRNLDQLVIVCADLKKPPFQPGHFDALLCIEVLYYLIPSLGRSSAITTPVSLLGANGTMVLSEFSRLGRAIIDLDAMDLANVRSLIETSTRWEKSTSTRIKSFQWSLAELKHDLSESGLDIIDQTGISLAAALFSFAWSFTSYPLRPPLDAGMRELLEQVSDGTSDAIDASRNLIFALKKAKQS